MYACRHMCIVLGWDPLKPTCSQIGAFCICVVVSMVIDFHRGIFNKFHFTRNVFNDEKSQHIIMAICKNVLANLCLICTIYLDAFIQSSYAPGTVILRDGVIMGGPSFSKIKVLYNRWFHEEPLTWEPKMAHLCNQSENSLLNSYKSPLHKMYIFIRVLVENHYIL